MFFGVSADLVEQSPPDDAPPATFLDKHESFLWALAQSHDNRGLLSEVCTKIRSVSALDPGPKVYGAVHRPYFERLVLPQNLPCHWREPGRNCTTDIVGQNAFYVQEDEHHYSDDDFEAWARLQRVLHIDDIHQPFALLKRPKFTDVQRDADFPGRKNRTAEMMRAARITRAGREDCSNGGGFPVRLVGTSGRVSRRSHYCEEARHTEKVENWWKRRFNVVQQGRRPTSPPPVDQGSPPPFGETQKPPPSMSVIRHWEYLVRPLSVNLMSKFLALGKFMFDNSSGRLWSI